MTINEKTFTLIIYVLIIGMLLLLMTSGQGTTILAIVEVILGIALVNRICSEDDDP